MKKIRATTVVRVAASLTLIGCLLALVRPVSAARLANRTIAVGDPKPGVITTHTFTFDFQTAASTGSVVFEYCANDPLFENPCIPPVDMDVSGAVIDSQSGETGFAVHAASTANRLILTRPASVVTPAAAEYVFSNILNTSTNNSANYVRLSTHASSDGTGARIDEGGLAFRILTGISTEAYVPPYLLFCVGITVALDCSTSAGSYIDLGELSTTEPKTGTSQFAAATNDESGYLVTLFGTTLTAGNQVIPALAVPSSSQVGDSQFGLNLRANSSPDVGEEPVGSGSAAPAADYATPDLFKFDSGDVIVSTALPTEYNRFTASYLVNISNSQAAGIYTATFTYLATATF